MAMHPDWGRDGIQRRWSVTMALVRALRGYYVPQENLLSTKDEDG